MLILSAEVDGIVTPSVETHGWASESSECRVSVHPVRRNGEEWANHEKAFGVVYYEGRGSGWNSDSAVVEWYLDGMSVRGDVKLASNR